MKTLKRVVLTSLLIFPLAFAGCGGGGGLPDGETGTVTGTVTYNGQPVPEGSTVVFIKSGGGAGVSGNGSTDGSGVYELGMRDGTDILAGTYQVGVSPPPVADASLTPDQIMEQAPELTGKGAPVAAAAKLAFPVKYTAPESSGLTFQVKAGENTLDIQMAD